MTTLHSIATCSCGKVNVTLSGPHIYCTACHCDDCQAAARIIDQLPASQPTLDAFDGTHYVLHRKDRYAIASGADLLQAHKLRAESPTRRMVASCCNTPMFLAFDNAQHWITVYRFRIKDNTPALQARIATKFFQRAEALPCDVPDYKTFPLKLIAQLLLSRARMALGR